MPAKPARGNLREGGSAGQRESEAWAEKASEGRETQERIDRGSGATLDRAHGLAGGARLRSRRSQTQAATKVVRARKHREALKGLS
jgi:hypothetical protein